MPEIIRRSVPESQFSDTVHPLLQRVFAARGVCSDQELDYSLKHLLSPDSLKGLPEAVALLITALKQQQRVLVVGDFDADGATSCVLSILVLRAMGLHHIDFLVPNRFEYGYGLTPEIVDQAQKLSPDLIITVDNGIASVEGVAKAKSCGIKVLITDHHLPPEVLPDADAIINPNQEGCEFPSKSLAGVGVIFYLLSTLRSELRKENWFVEQDITEPVMANYLDLVALGTVADVVPLDRNNRILVHQGLQRIQAGKCRQGILALLKIAGKDCQHISASDIGFTIGPRLNAAGRLDDMSVGIQCLLTEDYGQANQLAIELDDLNRERRAIEGSMQQEALQKIEKFIVDENDCPAGICLYDESWHEGIVGILASRIKEKTYRPVIAFAPAANQQGVLKGSARSIPPIHIRDVLDSIATQHPKVLQKFGGHAMAAGLSLEMDQYETFSKLFDDAITNELSEGDLQDVLLTDGSLLSYDTTLEMARTLLKASPWGQQFSEPLFDGRFRVVQQRIVGERHLKMVLAFTDDLQNTVDAIAFNVDTTCWPNDKVEFVNIVYHLAVNRYQGRESLQLLVKYIEEKS